MGAWDTGHGNCLGNENVNQPFNDENTPTQRSRTDTARRDAVRWTGLDWLPTENGKTDNGTDGDGRNRRVQPKRKIGIGWMERNEGREGVTKGRFILFTFVFLFHISYHTRSGTTKHRTRTEKDTRERYNGELGQWAVSVRYGLVRGHRSELFEMDQFFLNE